MSTKKFCYITGCEVIKDLNGYTLPYNNSILSIEEYLIEINGKEFRIFTSGLDEHLAEEKEDIQLLKHFQPIMMEMIEKKDKRVQGIFCWNCKNTPENFIKLENLLDEL